VPLEFDANGRGLVRFELLEKRTRTLTLLVDRTYKGTRWSDLAVSGIEIETH
jgi:hypothetical protein